MWLRDGYESRSYGEESDTIGSNVSSSQKRSADRNRNIHFNENKLNDKDMLAENLGVCDEFLQTNCG